MSTDPISSSPSYDTSLIDEGETLTLLIPEEIGFGIDVDVLIKRTPDAIVITRTREEAGQRASIS